MTFDDLVPLWHSSRNTPDPAQLERYKADIASHLGREYREFLWHIGATAALTIFLAGGFVQYLRSGGAFDPQREWVSLVFLLLPTGVALAFVRGFVKHRRQHPRYDFSIADGLRASIDQNRLARTRLRVSMAVVTAAIALVPVVTYQLQLVGKQRPHEAASMLVVFGTAYIFAMVWQVWKYRGLAGVGARLRDLLTSYER